MGTSSLPKPSLPPHARIFARPDVWMEGEAITQFVRVAELPGCVRAAGMPDLHSGRGPIGAAFAFEERVLPYLVGGDAGCGVLLFATTASPRAVDKLERRVRAAMDEDPLEGCDPLEVFDACWHKGARGLTEVANVPDDIAAMAERECTLDLGPSGDPADYRDPSHGRALGSIGSGNHFAEITRVTEVRDEAAADAMGLEKGGLVALVHTGSRGLGAQIGRRYGDVTLTGAAIDVYLADLAGAVRFAQANRFLVACRLLRALSALRRDKVRSAIDIVHNTIRREDIAGTPVWIHRKGAAPASRGEATVVLGSRGAPSWVLVGNGHEGALASVAHGAGRRMTRTEARAKLATRYKRAELGRTAHGGRIVCDDADLLYEEHPDAYKPIEPVVASLVDEGLAAPIASLVPLVTVKQ
ncbi:RtcB family protein [Polyangium jinanense]|uniref:tRNA-splicing ligase RtcB n=1 Tax=Polyangium jinanense TaxID=2829994 RepID=A0A9X3XH12_9BACT|nr:RtcB family protein [Polyangium jinanense]MDC3962873.1 RtcB family protein [Polyangium jinanense]MDC3987841.1 RtcB family protein [Polyangium jinanense]